jgi:hypothetical protein
MNGGWGSSPLWSTSLVWRIANVFQIGDKVRWSSQSGGSQLEKIGEVVAVIPPNVYPREDFLLDALEVLEQL